ncbi:MAG: exodeoxyribonuclease V subunit beta [Casimicrobiaceae bacterium]
MNMTIVACGHHQQTAAGMTTGFDVFGCDLAGINLIEASAGTGKTWNICALYLRLLLERGLSVRDVLVVTFTNAATAELRERVRRAVADTLDHVLARGARGTQPMATALVVAAERAGVPTRVMVERLELALHAFDEASILTIHGFCQRALADAPFTAGVPFTLDLLPDDRAMHVEVTRDFWRRHVAAGDLDPALARYLVRMQDDPDKWAMMLRKRAGKPLARLVWPDDIDAPVAFDAGPVVSAYAEAKAAWQEARAEVVDLLHASALTVLNKNTYKPASLDAAFTEWDGYFREDDPFARLGGQDSKADLCRRSRLADAVHKGKTAPAHRFCEHVEALYAAREALDGNLARARLQLVRKLLAEGPEVLRERKRQKRVLAYDDILNDLYRALQRGEEGPRLAATLRERFPAALIDEFQDTDPVQFGIFASIYVDSDAPVFLVGDPKQAIYSFRNADLHTYLRAGVLANARHSLDSNQRSTPDLIAAVNAIFSANPRAFMLEGLAYHPVEAGAKPRSILHDDSVVPRADCTVWWLPDDGVGQPLSKERALEATVTATAAEIARLLVAGQAGLIRLADVPLEPRHVAVLVRSHAQGARIAAALKDVGIGSVELSQDSVFATADAEEIERVLIAVLAPARMALLKAALATELLGYDAARLAELGEDETRLAAHMERFAHYRELWLQQGIGVMYRRLLTGEGVAARMLARTDGERRLTNLLHIGERLHEAARLDPAPDALLRWLHAQRGEERADEAAQLRLESDRDLVHIVTIHAAKGLEYPIVFCPFLWDGYLNTNSGWAGVRLYHDDGGDAVVDFRSLADLGKQRDDAIRERVRLEALAEAVRLTYVALTRASHRCYLVAGCYSTNAAYGNVSLSESRRSVANWLVAGAGHSPAEWQEQRSAVGVIEARWRELGARVPCLGVAVLPAGRGPRVQSPPLDPAALGAAQPPAHIAPPWRIGSYSALSLDVASDAAAVDHDLRVGPPADPRTPPQDLPPDDILAFPRGPMAGECLHAVLENIDFTREATWPDAIGRALAVFPVGGHAALRTQRTAMIGNLLRDLLATDLPDGIRLERVAATERLTELGFHLPSPRLAATALNGVLRDGDYPMPRLAFPDLAGYLKGYIDLVLMHAGRFYIVDWKSNHLGYTPGDYGPDAIAAAMAEHGYHLQHLLYALALHRYLGRRIAGYTFERHFGGVLYLFVRGVRPHWRLADGGPAGVYFHRLTAATLAALDDLFPFASEAFAPAALAP